MMRVVFMGTPEFAVPSLEALAAAGYTIAGVITTCLPAADRVIGPETAGFATEASVFWASSVVTAGSTSVATALTVVDAR